jgi:hypothetical protein
MSHLLLLVVDLWLVGHGGRCKLSSKGALLRNHHVAVLHAAAHINLAQVSLKAAINQLQALGKSGVLQGDLVGGAVITKRLVAGTAVVQQY